ncbi:MAG: PAS domain S-box protein [Variovorax sp.]
MNAPLIGDNGAVHGLFCECFDVTERELAHAGLRESEARFSEVANAAPVLIWMADTTRRCTWFNKPWLDFTGRTMAQEQGDGWAEGVHPEDFERCLAIDNAAFDRREPFRMDYRLRRHDGEWRTIDDHGVPRFSGDGAFLGYIGSCTDVTEHRATEAALRASEEQRRLATEAAEVELWDVDTVTDTLFWPPGVKAMFGISPAVPVSMADFYAGLHPEDVARTAAAYSAAADPERRVVYDAEYRAIGKEDGIVRWVAAKGRGVFDDAGRCVRMIGTAIDITRRKMAEQRLRQSEASLAETVATLDALLAGAPIGFAFFDLAHRYVRINAVLAAINGLPAQAHLGRTVADVIPANARAVNAAIDAVISSAKAFETVEIDGETPARPGELRFWLTSFFPVFDADGGVAIVGVTVIDITERRRAEAAVREMNETLESQVAVRTAERDRVWRNSRDLLVVADADGVFRAVSPAWTLILGHAPEEVVGRHFSAFVLPEDGARAQVGLDLASAGRDSPASRTAIATRTERRAGFRGAPRSRTASSSRTAATSLPTRKRTRHSPRPRTPCGRRRRWKPWASSPAASPTTSTTCCRAWPAAST